MIGSISRRGQSSWRLKFEGDRGPDGLRNIQRCTVRGSRREAEAKLAELVAAVGSGRYVEPSSIAVGDFVRARVTAWEAQGAISARTAQRYRQLVENQIVPHLGSKLLQKLRPLDLEAWHAALRSGGRVRGSGGVAPRTIGHAHKVLGSALEDAVENEFITRNICRTKPAPKVPDAEMVIVRDLAGLVGKLAGWRLGAVAVVALFTGARLGEVLALRWNRVDLDKKRLAVVEALEHTKLHGTRVKPPKTRAGRREISLPDILVARLREHRKGQLERRLQLGAGRLPEDALLFPDELTGELLSPNAVSAAWGHFAASIGQPELTFHGLRHSHVSLLIDQGVDIVTIAKRIGHAKPDITLRVYAHLFRQGDGKAAAAIDAVLGAGGAQI
ncbi:Integrase [Rhizobiales bacterium GAS113]|nr:Integrase [Rhizobiales bacterium GAS113]